MRLLHAISYVIWMFGQVLLGSFQVARAALSPREHIAPALVRLPLRLETDAEIATFASSITITPGTLTIGIGAPEGDGPSSLLVHAALAADADAVVAGLRDMEARLLLAFRGRAGRDAALERPLPVPVADERDAMRGPEGHAPDAAAGGGTGANQEADG